MNRPANKTKQNISSLFVKKLLKWNEKENTRQMPWKAEKDPYKIWLSEIILQQTRVEQGLNYYKNFIKAFPDVQTLAKAPEEKVFKLWEGLGYYSRVRNIILTARFIATELNGNFPEDHASILKLKGVGNYTAAAIASFAYNLPHSVLDGNVFRVLSRIFAIDTPIDSSAGKKEFSELAQKILPQTQAGVYNQAIMDFGAVVCKPLPECKICFFHNYCQAYLNNRQNELPVKEKKIKIKERWFNYFVLTYQHQIAIHQRTAKDIWQQLFEFLLVETTQSNTKKMLLKKFESQYQIANYKFTGSFQVSQRLSHQIINFNMLTLELSKKEKIADCKWIKITGSDQYAFPKTLQNFIQAQLK